MVSLLRQEESSHVLAAGLVLVGTTTIHMSLTGFAVSNIVLAVLWLGLTVGIARRFQELTR